MENEYESEGDEGATMAEDDIKTFKNFLPRLLQEKIESQKKGYKIALKRRKDREGS